MIAQLFEVGPGDVALTSDDWYTPRWLFDAAGLVFDLDVCAPVNPVFRTCPAREYLTVVEDGLVQPWRGTVWMNPPFSNPAPWIDRWAAHSSGLAIASGSGHHAKWLGVLLNAADALTMTSLEFIRPDGSINRPWTLLILAARGGECVEALARVAAADKYAAGAYHVRPAKDRMKDAGRIACATPHGRA